MTELCNPPCFQIGDKPNRCAAERHARLVDNKTPLYGEWTGWRMAGRHLVAPNGVRFTPKELDAIAWARKHAELRERKAARVTAGNIKRSLESRVIVLTAVTPARERFDGYA